LQFCTKKELGDSKYETLTLFRLLESRKAQSATPQLGPFVLAASSGTLTPVNYINAKFSTRKFKFSSSTMRRTNASCWCLWQLNSCLFTESFQSWEMLWICYCYFVHQHSAFKAVDFCDSPVTQPLTEVQRREPNFPSNSQSNL
jgi:hypothetical protein